MRLIERIKRLEELNKPDIDWNRFSIDCATIFASLDNGDPWETVSSKIAGNTIDALELSAEYWQRILDDRKAEYEKTFGVGSYEMNTRFC